MALPATNTDLRRQLSAALIAGGVTAVFFVTYSWGRLLMIDRLPAGAREIILGVMAGWVWAIAAFVPFLLAVLLVVAGPTRRAVITGAVIVYVCGLLVTIGQLALTEFPVGLDLVVLAVPLVRVVIFLGVATAVWLAYHGGYERLRSAVGDVDQHPLFASIADTNIGPALSIQRGLVVAGLAASIGAGGLVLTGGIGELLRAVGRIGTTETISVTLSQDQIWRIGIPPARFPVEWLFEASFLLAVLFVTGPQLRTRDVGKGIAIIFAVQSTVLLLPALVPPGRPVDLWAVSGPVLSPLGDTIILIGIAVAVWLLNYGGLGSLQSPVSSKLDIE